MLFLPKNMSYIILFSSLLQSSQQPSVTKFFAAQMVFYTALSSRGRPALNSAPFVREPLNNPSAAVSGSFPPTVLADLIRASLLAFRECTARTVENKKRRQGRAEHTLGDVLAFTVGILHHLSPFVNTLHKKSFLSLDRLTRPDKLNIIISEA